MSSRVFVIVAKPDYSDNKIVLAMVCGYSCWLDTDGFFSHFAWIIILLFGPIVYGSSGIDLFGRNGGGTLNARGWFSIYQQVGLPARGKSYLSNKLQIYLSVGLSPHPLHPPSTTDDIELFRWYWLWVPHSGSNMMSRWIEFSGSPPSLFLGLIFLILLFGPLSLKGV